MSAALRNSANLLRFTVRSGSLKSASVSASVRPIVPVKAASTLGQAQTGANAHGPNHQNCILCAQRRAASTKAPSAPVEEFESLSVSGNSSAVAQSQASASEALSAFEALKQKGSPSSSDYAACMQKLAEARDFPRCAQLLKEMKGSAMEIDSQIYSLVLSSVRRTLRPSEIRQLFGEALPQRFEDGEKAESSESSTSPFFGQVRQIVREMREAGVKPAMWFYEDFANQFAVTNQGGLLINLATAMEKRGEEPSTKFYNRMLHCLPRCGLIDRASMLFNRMVLKGTADYYTFLVRASSLIYTNQPEAARAIIADARARFSLDAVGYNILVKSYLSQGAVTEAINVFKQMTTAEDGAVAPNRVTCRTFLSYFYDSGDLSQAEPVVNYFSKAGFPETSEDYANLIKFFARYDPPRVLEVIKELRSKDASALASNHVLHSFLRILNDRQVMTDWKRSLSQFIIEAVPAVDGQGGNFFGSVAAELPFDYRSILQRISQPDNTTLEIVMKKLLQLRRYDSVRSLYDSIFAEGSPSSISVGSVHRNLYLTALLSSNELEGAKAFVSDMQQRRVPISSKNMSLMEAAKVAVPAGAMTVKKGQGITLTPRSSSKLNVL